MYFLNIFNMRHFILFLHTSVQHIKNMSYYDAKRLRWGGADVRVGFYFGFVGTYGIGWVFRLRYKKNRIMTENVYNVYIFSNLQEIILIKKNFFLLIGKPDNNST